MLSESATASVPFGPIPEEVANPSYPSDPARQSFERSRPARWDLQYLQTMRHNSYAPNVWGFTIYRAVFGPGSDERFAAGLALLEAWVRFSVRQSRYNLASERAWKRVPQYMPQPGDRDGTDDLAERLWNEVVEDYPDKLAVRSAPEGEEGSEDFSPVGRAFVAWVKGLNVDTSGLNVRYDHCLVLDDAALRSLEDLPAELPEIRPRPTTYPERSQFNRFLRNAWVWLLDREEMEYRDPDSQRVKPLKKEDQPDAPPWIRIRLSLLDDLWFRRPQGQTQSPWFCCIEEDRDKWDRVFWWNSSASALNQGRRGAREDAARKAAAGSSWNPERDGPSSF